ncbi:hypothetical protein DOTSEDRAFT_177860 [Dothistroma septosporum NZE10]|uniref:ASTRA-associated protein 1 n=1 Tax=Dothistroma septosporum (strain NZE10 / CBS 128990) TaxID=675120 RepID=N1PEF3_DOTSN|nr:hypothetical protein DOTSEDRAFT_177860 [Dothistroma septosporum NZE10]
MAQNLTVQSSEQSPAQPAYVLRGHSAHIHAVHFFRENARLITGDADGFVVIWSTASKRAVAVWRPHSTTILGLRSWDDDKIISHGRDNKLLVWQLLEDGESDLSTSLPIDDAQSERRQPWLLHSLRVNALNFCSFTLLPLRPHGNNDLPAEGILVATPGVQDGRVNVTSLPDEERIATIPAPQDIKTGMVMAVGMHFQQHEASMPIQELLVIAGYESGHACIWQQEGATRKWKLVYAQKHHSQPVLSLSTSPSQPCFFTSSADAVVVRHTFGEAAVPAKSVQTKHAGQQGLVVRNDDKIFATAGWDTRVRVYSVKTMKELAVLKWHKEGCYALAFAEVQQEGGVITNVDGEGTGDEGGELTVAERRALVAKSTHWLAVGSKDGKVSLWEIY